MRQSASAPLSPFFARHAAVHAGVLLLACGSPSSPLQATGSAGATAEANEAGGGGASIAGAPESGSGGIDPINGGATAGGAAGGDPDSTRFWSRLSLGLDFGCAIGRNNSVACWGTPLGGAAVITPPPGQFVELASGNDVTCGVTSTAGIECWGNVVVDAAAPVPAGLLGSFISIGTGEQCVVVASTGQLACWGAPQAIIGTVPTGTFSQVSLGRNYACAITVAGRLACWGNNYFGQATPPEGKFVQVTAGGYHACSLGEDGTAHCWGLGDASMPTNGGVGATGNDATEPWGQAIAPVGKKFKRLAVGFLSSCGILESGDVECWGAGTASSDCNTVATCGQALPQPGPFVDLALGYTNSCGILTSGKIKCWGSNTGGRSTPPLEFQ